MANWEIRHFGKAFHKNHKQVNVTSWWRNQKARYFDKMREEFELGLRESRPCWKSACQQKIVDENKSIPYTICTTESILGTKGLLVMLLHWATNYQKYTGRAAAQAMLYDLLQQVLSAVDKNDEMWSSFTGHAIAEEEDDKPLYHDHASATTEEDWHPISYHEKMEKDASMYMAVARSLEDLFANRKRLHQWRVQLMNELNVLESRMNKIVLSGMVGQESLDSPSLQVSRTSQKRALGVKQAAVQQSSTSEVASQPAKANRALQGMKRSRRSLSQPAKAILASRNMKRTKRSSPWQRPLKAQQTTVQQTSRKEVSPEPESVSLALQRVKRPKRSTPEIQGAKVQQCSVGICEPIMNAMVLNGKDRRDSLAQPSLQSTNNEKGTRGRPNQEEAQ